VGTKQGKGGEDKPFSICKRQYLKR